LTFLYKATVWHWWILGSVFLMIELVVPGACFLWLAISAGILGAVTWMIPALSLTYQLLLFSIISVIAVTFYLCFRSKPQKSHILNQRAKQYIGYTFILEDSLETGYGKVQLGDTIWSIKGPRCGKGTKVKIVSNHGSTLQVEIL
jgi:membrane protein implicated in regulation of membrane protease activity